VRVDILERLADLIRPALAWRPASPQQRPPGAVEGGGFTVTVNMTSLTGTSGEDFASVLRSLGYRMEKRPKPVEATVSPAPEATPAESAAEAPASDATAETSPETPVEAAIAPVAEAAPKPTAAPAEPAAAIEAASETAVAAAVAPAAPETAETPPAVAEAKAEEKSAEPETIEVWRPGRPPEERRARPPRREGERREQGPRRDRRPRPQVAAQPAQNGAQAAASAKATATESAQPAPQNRRPHHARGRSEGAERPEREGRPQQRERRGGERPDRDRSERGDRPRREGRRDFKDRDRGEPREWIDPKERRGQADPNSPFAKLAALKEQLEASKER